jgi:hypothetical protein
MRPQQDGGAELVQGGKGVRLKEEPATRIPEAGTLRRLQPCSEAGGRGMGQEAKVVVVVWGGKAKGGGSGLLQS